jgi:hypothetical protein
MDELISESSMSVSSQSNQETNLITAETPISNVQVDKHFNIESTKTKLTRKINLDIGYLTPKP